MTNPKKNWIDNPLPILVSARVRLDDQQRRALKDAYFTRKNAQVPTESEGYGGVSVQTAYGADLALDRELQMSQLVFSDLVNSRDSISVNIILNMQKVLGVEVLTKEDVSKACESYINYIFNK